MKVHTFKEKLAQYITMSAAFLAANAEKADAQIMYTDVNPDIVIQNGFFNLDLNNDGVADFKLEQHSQNLWGNLLHFTFENNYCLNNNEAMENIYYPNFPYPLLGGVAINQNQIFGNGSVLAFRSIHSTSSTNGQYATSTNYEGYFGLFGINNQYLGLKLFSNGNTYYGWARLDVNILTSNIIIKDYAINLTPDSSINAGQVNGCIINNNITMTPDPSIGNVNWICNNDSLQLSIHNVNGYSFQWSNNNQIISGANDSTFNASISGNYGVFVSNSSCIYFFNNIQIDTLPASPPITNFITPEHCNHSDGSITANINGGINSNTFLWNTGETTQTINNLSAGLYIVTVTTCNGLTQTDSAFIPNLPGPVLTENHAGACGSHLGTIQINVAGGMAWNQFQWSTGSTNWEIYLMPAGSYTVTVTDIYNCSTIMQVTIPDITPVLSAVTDSICTPNNGYIDLSVSGGASGYYYIWNTGAGTQDLTGLNAGIYSVTVTIPQFGCPAVLDVSLNNSVPSPTISFIQHFLLSSYTGRNQWYLDYLNNPLAGDTLNYLFPSLGGNYIVEAIYPNACSNFSAPYLFWPTGIIENENIPFVSIATYNKKLLFHISDNSLIGKQIEIVNELGQLVTTVTVINQNPEADLSALPAGIYFFHIRSKQKYFSGKFFIE